MSTHDALFRAHDVITAGASKHRLHTCTGEIKGQGSEVSGTITPAGSDRPRTDFAAQVPQFERAVVAPRHDAGVVQEEAGGQHLPAVTRQGVLDVQTQRQVRSEVT